MIDGGREGGGNSVPITKIAHIRANDDNNNIDMLFTVYPLSPGCKYCIIFLSAIRQAMSVQ